MIPSPIRTVLSSIRKHQVQALLMGGQACVLYGAAEFSRDTDLAVLAESENLQRLQAALAELQAEVIAVPPLEQRYLDMGLGVHFRCQAANCRGMRIDVLSKMRGVDEFAVLWNRRITIDAGEEQIDVLALPDLVKAKKTQRAKYWPMIQRLIESNYFHTQIEPTPEQINFWLLELRTPALLVKVAQDHLEMARSLEGQRPLVCVALEGDERAVADAMTIEEQEERAADRAYWAPLKAELERLRHAAHMSNSTEGEKGDKK